MRTLRLKIRGMTCPSCESRIERRLHKTEGVLNVKASFSKGIAVIYFDENKTDHEIIASIIEELDYKIEKTGDKTVSLSKIIVTALVLFAIVLLLSRSGVLDIFNAFPQAQEGMGYGMLFVTGLLTSLHCLAMCGGISLSQCLPHATTKADEGESATLIPSLQYNFGRIISYTTIGAIVGAAGSAISFSGTAKGIVQLLAGAFMVIMGLNMLNLFPSLRKFALKMPKFLTRKIAQGKVQKGPLFIGLLNGLMPCGPLQAMQLYALSTGSPTKGALSMLFFSLGTVPLMFSFGAFSTYLGKKFTRKMMTASAALVVILGLSMFTRGMSLSGLNIPYLSNISSPAHSNNTAKISGNLQTVTTKLYPGKYEPISVQKGIPVKWTIKAEEKDINGCNNEIYIPKFNMAKKLQAGDNVIEFTPTEKGTFVYSCWMGMIRSSITVVDNAEDAAANQSNTAEDQKLSPAYFPTIKTAKIKLPSGRNRTIIKERKSDHVKNQ